MKYDWKALIAVLLVFSAVCFPVFHGSAEEAGNPMAALTPVFWEEVKETGLADSFVEYPRLNGDENPEAQTLAEKVNAAILDAAQIPAYLQLLPTVQEGGTGLTLTCETSSPYTVADDKWVIPPFMSFLFSAKGKMLVGRPSQVYYPLTLNMNTGEPVAFEELFSDPEGAKAFIEATLEEDVEPTLSTYLENNQLFPMPYDRFFLDGQGNLILCYENSQLSFLSGDSGAVAFRYSELWDWLDTAADSIPMSVLDLPEQYTDHPRTVFQQMDEICVGPNPLYGFGMEGELGMSVEELTALYPQAADSDYYPGGACFEVETPTLRGTLILTDESETTLTGILAHRVDFMGIFTGKTLLADAEALMGQEPTARMTVDEAFAEMYRVCPGEMAVYPWGDGRLTLYADESGVVQYIGMSLSR